YYCKNAASDPCTERALVHAEPFEEFVSAWFKDALRSAPRVIDVVTAERELEEAQAEQERAEAELLAYVDVASALDATLFQRGLDKRQSRRDDARAGVRDLSARRMSLPVGGSLVMRCGTASLPPSAAMCSPA